MGAAIVVAEGLVEMGRWIPNAEGVDRKGAGRAVDLTVAAMMSARGRRNGTGGALEIAGGARNAAGVAFVDAPMAWEPAVAARIPAGSGWAGGL